MTQSSLWRASAPANIAIIKYMGKAPGVMSAGENPPPLNPSLSMTLKDFTTTVEISPLSGPADRWEPLPGAAPIPGGAGDRFLKFFHFLKSRAGVQQAFLLRSGNNFPSDAGLASSASSFAALTHAATLCFHDLQGKPKPSPEFLASLSKLGSGSSCRSFFSPWCGWEQDRVYAVPSKLEPLVDCVVILSDRQKKVSSSEAHKRVVTSPLMHGRAERATARMRAAEKALSEADFKTLAEIAWADSWEMHSLFHTSAPPFTYFLDDTITVLRAVEDLWEKEGYGPIATMDAGPNVHLLMRPEEKHRIKATLDGIFRGKGLRWLEST